MVPYLESSSLVGDLDNVPPFDLEVSLSVVLMVVDRYTLAAVANGNDTPILIFSQELVLSVARKLLGNLKELVVGLSSGIASLGLVDHYHLSLVVLRLYMRERERERKRERGVE